MRPYRIFAAAALAAATALAHVALAGVVHSAKNVGSGNGAELATYIVEKGKPLLTLAQ